MLKYFHTLLKGEKSMTKTKSLSLAALLVVVLGCIFLLAACGETQYRLNATASVGGSVSGAGEIAEGQTATLTATPDVGYKFVGWYDNAEYTGNAYSTANPLVITVTQDLSFYALFDELERYTISVVAGNGGFVSGNGDYYENSTTTIAATANAGYYFVGWYTEANGMGNLISTSANLEVNVTQDQTYYAYFDTINKGVTVNTIGNGTVTGAGEHEKGDEVTLTATASEGYYFAGWYSTSDASGLPVSSANPYTFTLENDTVLYALFNTKPSVLIDRILNGAYNTYATFDSNEQEKTAYNVNADVDITLDIPGTIEGIVVNLSANASLDTTTQTGIAEIELALGGNKDAGRLLLLGIYYVDTADDQMLYIYLGQLLSSMLGAQQQYAINFDSLLKMLDFTAPDFPDASNEVWNIDSIISQITDNALLQQVISGVLNTNTLNVFTNITNNANDLSFDVNLTTILNLLKNIDLGETFSQVMEVLTGAYANGSLPALTLGVNAGFETVSDLEYLRSAGLSLNIGDEYSLNLGEGTQITLPSMTLGITVNELSMGFGDANTNVSDIETQFANVNAINALNLHVGADFNIYSGENGETTDHAYRLEVNTDIDPFAIIPAIQTAEDGTTIFDVNAIDWENLGFLSIRIFDPTGEANDYLNVLYDSKMSTQVYIYANFVNPITIMNFLTLDLNTSFDINEFVDLIEGFVQLANGNETEQANINSAMLLANERTSTTPDTSTATETTTVDAVLNALMSLIAGENFNKVVVNLISAFAPDFTGLAYNETKGIVLDLSNVSDALTLDLGDGITLDFKNILFGNGTFASIKFDSFSYGSVNERNIENEMINPVSENKTSFKDELATASTTKWSTNDNKMISKVNSVDALKNAIFSSETDILEQLDSITANVEFIDGTTETIPMVIQEMIVNESNEINSSITTQNVTFVLSPARSTTDMSYIDYKFLLVTAFLQGQGIMLTNGAFTYTTDVVITSATSQVQTTEGMTDEEILAIFSDTVLGDVKNDTYHRTIVSADITGIDESVVKWTLTDGEFVLNGDSPTGVYVDEEAPSTPTIAAVMIGWAEGDFDKEWTVEFYVMNGDEKIVFAREVFTPALADYTKTEATE